MNKMKKFYEEFMAGLERDAVEEVVEVLRVHPRKVPEAVRLRWTKNKALSIIADAEADVFTQSLKVDPVPGAGGKRARLKGELDIYYSTGMTLTDEFRSSCFMDYDDPVSTLRFPDNS